MAKIKERSDLRQVAPGLYESVVDGNSSARLTHEYAQLVRQHTGSKVLEEIVEEAVRRREATEGKAYKAHFD